MSNANEAAVKTALDKIERLPTLIVAGTRFLAKELADGHGLEQNEWLYIDTVAKVNAFKADEIMFGRGAEKVPGIRGIVEISKTLGHKVVFGDYPKLIGETDAPASPALPPVSAPPTPPTDAAPERRDMRRRENRPPTRKGADEIKDVLGEITAMESKYEALLRKLITIAERKLAVLGELKTEGEEG